MLRRLYVFLVRLHPRRFRQRFGDEMLWIYDCAATRADRAWLVADALLSALRQHTIRSSNERAGGEASEGALAGAPAFVSLDFPEAPRPLVLLRGMLATVLVWWVFSLGMQVESNNRKRDFGVVPTGSRYVSDGHLVMSHAATDAGHDEPARLAWREIRKLWSSARARVVSTARPATTRLGSDAKRGPDTWYLPGLILHQLDPDRAGRTPHSLSGLDGNRDGRISVREWGLGFGMVGTGRTPDVFHVLDADGDGELSRDEIADAFRVLKSLDRNGDGKLTLDELQAARAP